MSRITAFIHLTLDGVMQAPGRPDEDCRDGFEHGGWAMHYNDADQAKAVGQSMANTGAILLGRSSIVRLASGSTGILEVRPRAMLGQEVGGGVVDWSDDSHWLSRFRSPHNKPRSTK